MTVVIPTMGRPELLRALESVRAQTYDRVEAVVVLDDPTKEASVRRALKDETLLVTSGRTGGANARNLGLASANTALAAFLDDDDWWEPEKVAVQVRDLCESGADVSFTGTQFHAEDGGIRILPRRPRKQDETIASYLVVRPRLKHGEGYIQTSSILGRTELIREIGWDSQLPKHQDWDLVVRLADAGRHFSYTPSPLVHVHQGSAGSISRTANWRASRVWLERHKHQLSRRACGDFVATQILRAAAGKLDPKGLLTALRELVLHPPHPAALLVGLHGFRERGQ